MNKPKLSTLVALSVNSVVFMASQLGAAEPMDTASAAMDAAQQAMSADQQVFANQLNQAAATVFKNMTPQQRSMCMQMAGHDCKGKNACKGQGNCKTTNHDCSGKNACKGQGNCKTDPNKAVKSVAENMMQKRMGAQ